jgi:microcin C transport system substrate-binding protein
MWQRLASFLLAILFTLLLPLAGNAAPDATANEPVFRHGFSFFGELLYPADYTHFDYVNPNAPVGGDLVVPVIGTFNSFTPWIQKGINPAGYGFVGAWIFLFDRVLEPSDDEPAAQYARLGESIAHADDYSWFKVRIDPRARWHDGTPITPADLIFTNDFIRDDATAAIRTSFKHFGDAIQTGPLEVTFHIDDPDFRNPSAGLSIGHLPILPAHYWKDRDISKTSLTPPLGSGPYKITEFEPGKRIVYQRVADYWGWQVPSVKGKYNFDRIIFEYFRDHTVAREAAKKGILYFRSEAVAKDWMTSYADLPSVKDGYFVQEIAEQRNITSMAGAIIINTRRDKFENRLVRKALTYAFDFEWINRVLNYGFYLRVKSYFDNSELASTGLPEGRELELLNEFRAKLPNEVFTEEFSLPKSDGLGLNRANMLEAERLFSEAGWNVVDGKLLNEYGEQFTFELLTRNATEERGGLPYIAALKRLGIDARIRTADAAQFRNRVRNFEFDACYRGYWATPTLGTYLKAFYHSDGANDLFTENWAGIRNEAGDAFIERALSTFNREELLAAGRALDRVMLHNYYMIPTQVEPGARWSYWDRFGRAEKSGKYRYHPFPETWWTDADKSAAVDAYLNATEDED